MCSLLCGNIHRLHMSATVSNKVVELLGNHASFFIFLGLRKQRTKKKNNKGKIQWVEMNVASCSWLIASSSGLRTLEPSVLFLALIFNHWSCSNYLFICVGVSSIEWAITTITPSSTQGMIHILPQRSLMYVWNFFPIHSVYFLTLMTQNLLTENTFT